MENFSIFEFVKNLFNFVNNVELLWCPKKCNEVANEAAKCAMQMSGIGTRHLSQIPFILNPLC